MFTAASSTILIQTGFANFSVSALTILGIALSVSVGLLVFYFGTKKISNTAGFNFDLSDFNRRADSDKAFLENAISTMKKSGGYSRKSNGM